MALAQALLLALFLTGTLAACAARLGRADLDPIVFLDSETKFLDGNMVEVKASAAFPTIGAVAAYSDCVAARYALERNKSYVSRVLTRPSGLGDIVTETTTYLLSSVAPGGANVLNARQILSGCNTHQIPTE